MNELILVKHAAPEILRDRPSRRWRLSSLGRRQCEALQLALTPYEPSSLISSEEPKAVETGEIVGKGLGIPFSSWSGLHENDRTGLPFFDNEDEYGERFRTFFDRPSDRIIGNESADEAHDRFIAAVRSALAVTRGGTTVIVAHGTVTSLLVSRANDLAPYPFWRDLAFTSFVVLCELSFKLREVVHPTGSEKSGGGAHGGPCLGSGQSDRSS